MRRVLLLLAILLFAVPANAATLTWDNAAADNDGDNVANWAPDHNAVPGASDIAEFDTTDDNCTFSDAQSFLGISITGNYDGDIDLGGAAIGIGSSGIVVASGGSGSLTLTSGTLTITSGPFTINNLSGNFDDNNGTVVFAGTGNTIAVSNGDDLRNVDVTGSTTLQTGNLDIVISLDISASLTVDTQIRCTSNSTASIETGGTLTGDGMLLMDDSNGGTGIDDMSGTCSIAVVRFRDCLSDAVFKPGTYASAVQVQSNSVDATWAPSAGTYTLDSLELEATGANDDVAIDASGGVTHFVISGDLTFDVDDASGTATLSNSGKTNNITIGGDIVDENQGTVTWTRGTGTLTANGSGAQAWDTATVWAVEDTVVNKSDGTLTLGDDYNCASFTVTDGGFSDGGNAITTINNFSWAADDALTLTGTPTIGGTTSLTVGTGELTIKNTWDGELSAGTYNASTFKIQNTAATDDEWEFGSGAWTFAGDFEAENTNAGGTLTIKNTTNSPTFVFEGSWITDEQAGAVNWTRSATETITFQ